MIAASAEKALVDALLAKDEAAFRLALEAGADPFRAKLVVSKPYVHTLCVASCVVAASMPLSFVRAMLGNGDAASQLLGQAVRYGNEHVFQLLAPRVSSINPGEWLNALGVRKPHRMLGRLFEYYKMPECEKTRAMLVGKAILRGDMRALDRLVAEGVYFEGILAHASLLADGSKNPRGYRHFLNAILAFHPDALDNLHASGVGVLHELVRKHHPPTEDAMKQFLAIPALAKEISFVASGGGVMEMALQAGARKVWRVLEEHGGRFPGLREGESSQDYYRRLLPPSRSISDLLADGALWSAIQAHHLADNAPASAPLRPRARI